MSAIHNDLFCWANKARAQGRDRIELDNETALKISQMLMDGQAENDKLRAERDEALDRVEELEREADRVSNEFEKDCWVAMRSLLNACDYDWNGMDVDGVTADEAREHIQASLTATENQVTRLTQALAAEESRSGRLAEALRRAGAELDRISCEGVTERRSVSVAFERALFFANRGAAAVNAALKEKTDDEA